MPTVSTQRKRNTKYQLLKEKDDLCSRNPYIRKPSYERK